MNRRGFFSTIAGGLVAAPSVVAIAGPRYRPLDEPPGELRWLSAEERELLKFYAGEQWPAEDLAMRREQGRPSLVHNRLPEVVQRILAVPKEHLKWVIGAGPVLHAVGGFAATRMVTIVLDVTRRYKDAQVMHNYFLTAALEADLDAEADLKILADPTCQYGETPRITRQFLSYFGNVARYCRRMAEEYDPVRRFSA